MAEAKTFASLGRVEAIRQLFEGSGYTPFGEPLFYEAKAHDSVTSAQVLLLEGMDFNLEYFPLRHLGYKSVVAAAGELAAVMAKPQTLAVNLGISAKLDYEHIEELWSGILAASKRFKVKSLSLDLQPSKNGLAIAITATGSCKKETASRRSVAQSKDLICVSGRLGAAYLGQQVLEKRSGELEKYKMMLSAYLKPELNPDTVAQLEELNIAPSFGYFVNRGLADALLRLNRDSGLGVKVYADKIPFEGNSFALGKVMDIDPISAAMNGGDDYVLLYTVPILKLEEFHRNFPDFEIIGHLARPEVGTVLVSPDGLEYPVSAQGWSIQE